MPEATRARKPMPVLPDLQLAWPDGRSVHLSELRQDRNLVALFSGGAECGACRHVVTHDLCGRPEEYVQSGATAVLVLHCSPLEAELVRHRDSLTIPVLIDPTGEACRAAGAWSPGGRAANAIVVTDCAGRVYLASRPDQLVLPPTREAIFNCLRSIPATGCAEPQR